MSFVRVNAAGWPGGASGSEVTSTQINGLDKDHANALDKRGDSTTGAVTFAAGSTISIASGATLDLGSFGVVTTTSGDITIGSLIDIVSGNTIPQVTLGAGSTGTISATAALLVYGTGATIKTASGGRLQLADNDWPTFLGGSRTRSVIFDLSTIYTAYGTGWSTLGLDGLVGPSTGLTNPATIPLPTRVLHNGATLSQIVFYFTPSPTGTAIPAVFQTCGITQRSIAAGAGLPARASIVSGAYTASVVSSYRSGKVQSLALSPGAVIDMTTKEYALSIVDENGTGAVGKTTFHAVKFVYTVPDMRFA